MVDSNNNILEKEKIPLLEQIKEDFSVPCRKDPAYNGFLELFFNYQGLLALVHHRVAHRLYHRGFRLLGRIIMGWAQFLTSMDIHPAAYIGRRVFIDHGIGVVIGETAQIGNDVTIYQGVSLGGVSLEKTKRHPTVLHNVVIGAGAKVLGNILIGENAKIGSNSVVIKNVPRDATAVGIPARIIGEKSVSKGADSMGFVDSNKAQDSIISNTQNENLITTKLPDIDKKMFEYILCRLNILESKMLDSVDSKNADLKEQKEKLDEIYKDFLKAMEK